MKILINKTDKNILPVIKIYDLGSVTTTINDLLNESTITLEKNITPVLSIDGSNYLINNFNSTNIKEDFEAIITESDLISLSSASSTDNLTINLTKSEANDLKNTNSLVPGLNYTITDADINLYGGTEITLTAITPSELSLQGSGKFYCPKYDVSAESTGYGIWTKQMEGTFSNIVGLFDPNEVVTSNEGATAKYLEEGFLEWISGNWNSATSISGATATADISGFVTPGYNIGQVVHWGGKSWTNVNGNIGASIDKYTLDAEWQEIPFNETDYNVYIDEIHYDFGNDMIIYRKDRYNNVVRGSHQVFVEFKSPDGYGFGNPIKDFQWGCMQDDFNTNDYFNLGIQGNEVIFSYFETLNTRGKYIWFNKLSQGSYIFGNTLSSSSFTQYNTFSSYSYTENTTLSNSSIHNITLNSSSIIDTKLGNDSSLNNTILNNSFIAYTDLGNTSIINTILNSSGLGSVDKITGKTVSNLEIRNSNIAIPNTAVIIFNQNISKTIFKRLDGTPRLQYVDNSDVVVITDVDA